MRKSLVGLPKLREGLSNETALPIARIIGKEKKFSVIYVLNSYDFLFNDDVLIVHTNHELYIVSMW